MKFFDRKGEIALLREIRGRSREVAQFSVVTGRRRVGKTSLISKAYEDEKFVYLFVERQGEKELCETFKAEIEQKLGIVIHGTPSRFSEIFEELMKTAEERNFTVVIDEFQEFLKINASVFSSIQKLWDLHKSRAKINLVVTGSVHTLMRKLFRNKKAALYGRETAFMTVSPFTTTVLKEILATYSPKYTKEDLLALWTFTGGVAKYVELLIDQKAYTREKMICAIVKEDSVFLDEGRALLVEEFDKEYGVYFSILSAIARGKTSRNDIEQAVGRQVSGYLARLEEDYALIAKRIPFLAKPAAKCARYQLDDNFLIFWFRFVFRHSFLLQTKGYEQLRELIRRDYETFSGFSLERYFKAKFAESGEWTLFGGWWDRKGENEIDLLAENELTGVRRVFEIKRNKKLVDLNRVQEKFAAFVRASGEWKRAKPEFVALSMEEM